MVGGLLVITLLISILMGIAQKYCTKNTPKETGRGEAGSDSCFSRPSTNGNTKAGRITTPDEQFLLMLKKQLYKPRLYVKKNR